MGVNCCTKMVINKTPSLKKQKTDKSSLLFRRLVSYYNTNREYMNSKLLNLFSQIVTNLDFERRDVNLSFVNLRNNRVRQLVEILPYFRSIQYLSLWKSGLGRSGISAIQCGLSNLTELAVLILSDNEIDSEGTIYLARALRNLVKLKELWLDINDIGPVGAVFLADALVTLEKLEKIGIDENSIEGSGGLKIVRAIKVNHKVNHIGLGYNNISQEACFAILEELKGLPLEKVILSGNIINQSSYRVMKDLIPNAEIII